MGAVAARQLRTGSAIYAEPSIGERDSHSIQIHLTPALPFRERHFVPKPSEDRNTCLPVTSQER